MGKAIEAQGLKKAYGAIKAVDGLSLEVEEGEIFGMVGPNGAGKTTTIECLEGLREPDSGQLRVLGLDPLGEEGQLRPLIGCQLQQSRLPELIKVGEAIDLFASLYEAPVDPAALLERLGLAERRGSFVSKLSGGQQQRLYIALALVNRPRLVFFDELTTGVDPQARREIWDLLREIRSEGRTVFLTTHSMEEAEKLCDRVAIVDHGRIAAIGSPSDLVGSLGAESRVSFRLVAGGDLRFLEGLETVSGVWQEGPTVVVSGRADPEGRSLIAEVVGSLSARGIAFDEIKMEEPSLEDVFLRLTEGEARGERMEIGK
jgi:ABC-2 type transport system ATP-binding protein